MRWLGEWPGDQHASLPRFTSPEHVSNLTTIRGLVGRTRREICSDLCLMFCTVGLIYRALSSIIEHHRHHRASSASSASSSIVMGILMKPTLYPVEVWGTCSAWWHGGCPSVRDHLTLASFLPVPGEYCSPGRRIRQVHRRTDEPASFFRTPRSLVSGTCCAWDRPRDQANRGINHIVLDTQNPCDRDISLCPSVLENKMR